MSAQTKPKNDALVQELREAWPALIRTFGRENVLIVSNSAGTRDDAGFLQVSNDTAIGFMYSVSFAWLTLPLP